MTSSAFDSPSSTRPSPFSSLLPNEVIQLIIESTVPANFHSSTYSLRQWTLRSLCLVSKLFHEIAKPLLLTIAHLDHPNSWRLWKASIDQQESRTNDLRLGTNPWRPVEIWIPANIEAIIPLCRNLSTLGLYRLAGDFDISILSQVPHLRSLNLTEVKVTQSCTTIPASVVHMTLEFESDSLFSSIFNRTTFPALRTLAYYGDNVAYDLKDHLVSFLDDLEDLSLESYTLDDLPQALADKLVEKTLFDQALDDDYLPPVRFLRRSQFWPSVASPISENLTEMHSESTSTSFPTLLYLPAWLETDYLALENLDTVGRGDGGFRIECQRRGIEVVFEEQPSSWVTDSEVSRDFWRRMKKKR